MKRLICILLAVLSLTACIRERLEETFSRREKASIVFEGTFVPETKIAFGEAVDGAYPLRWTKGDAIGIFSYNGEETDNRNMKGELYEETEESNKGIFIPVDKIYEVPAEIEGGEPVEVVDRLSYPQNKDEDFFVYYPYRDGAELVTDPESGAVSFSSRLLKVQPQLSLGDCRVGENGFSCAMAHVKAGSGKANFELEHKMAYICFKATSSEFSGYQLRCQKE